MVITEIGGGIGNQLFHYAAGRRLAHKWNTELKLEVSWYDNNKLIPYILNAFNIQENFAAPEEIERIKKLRAGTDIG